MSLAALSFLFLLLAQEFGQVAERLVLKNGLTVLFLRAAEAETEARKVEMHLCFPNGRVLEPQPGAIDVCLADLQRVESEQSREIFPFTYVWVEDEVCGISFSILPDDPDSQMQRIAQRLWQTPPRIGAVFYNQWGSCFPPPRSLRKEDFLPAMLRKSRYASLKTNYFPALTEFPDSLREFRTNLFQPRQAILVVDGGRTSELEQRIRQTLEGNAGATFSMSYSVVEEMPHLPEKAHVIFEARPLPRPQFAAVFPAPARGSEETKAFAALVSEARERFGESRVSVWSGLGTGLFWIEYESSLSRFSEILPQFVKAVEDFRDEMIASFEPHEPLDWCASDSWIFNPERALAARHFWGIGCQDWDQPAASAKEIRAVASSYLRRPALFVLWPESRKDEWKGFP